VVGGRGEATGRMTKDKVNFGTEGGAQYGKKFNIY
jgi:hypothetical protein